MVARDVRVETTNHRASGRAVDRRAAGRGGAAGLAAALLAAGLWAASPAAAVAEGEPEEAATGAAESAPSTEPAEPGTDAEPEGAAEPEEDGGSAEAPEGEVARAAFTRAVVDREPTDRVDVLENDTRQIYYFTELQGLEGATVTHRWQHDGEVKAEVPFEVGGPRWRVYSSKELDPSWLGEWTVSVVDEAGRVLRRDRFRYREETPEETPEDAPPAPAPDVP